MFGCHDGKEGLELFEKNLASLSDIMMPNMNGASFISSKYIAQINPSLYSC